MPTGEAATASGAEEIVATGSAPVPAAAPAPVPATAPVPAPAPECATTPRTGSRRIAAVDVARALAVIGVVINHAIDGLVDAGLLPRASLVAECNAALLTFRMPTLAFLLGLLIPVGVARAGGWTYLRRRAVLFGYLYLVWFYVQGTAEVAANGVKNHARSPLALLTPWVPVMQLWFLPFLVTITALFVVIAPWRSGLRTGVAFVVCAGLTYGLWGFNPEIVGVHGLALALFVLLGAAVDARRFGRVMGWPVPVVVVAFVVGTAVLTTAFLAGAVPGTSGTVRPDDAVVVVSFFAASGGVVALLAVSALLARVGGFPARALAAVGRRTLVIFLAHLAVVAGARIALARSGVTEPWVILPVAVTLGVCLPLLLGRLAEGRPWLSWLVTPPRRAGSAGQGGNR